MRIEYLYEKEIHRDLARLVDKALVLEDKKDIENLLINQTIKISEIQAEIRAAKIEVDN